MKKLNSFVCHHLAKRFPQIKGFELRRTFLRGVPKQYLLILFEYEIYETRNIRRSSRNYIGDQVTQFLFNYFLIKVDVQVRVETIPIANESDYNPNDYYYDTDSDDEWVDEVIDLRGRRFPV
jgi:hypothetical protein